MFCCQTELPQNEQGVNFKQLPLKVKILQTLGLKSYLINKFVFAKPEAKYTINRQKEKLEFVFTDRKLFTPFSFNQSFHVLSNEQVNIPLIMLSPKDKPIKSVVIFSHGNGSDLAQSYSFISSLAQMHFDQNQTAFIGYDYTGYGQSTIKETTTQSICLDLQNVIAWLDRSVDQIILIGFSLGCYPTAKIAAKYKVKGVILIAPLMSLYSWLSEQQTLNINSFFKDDELNTFQIIQNVQSHLLIIHSRDDQLTPVKHSKLIYQRYCKFSKNQSVRLIQVDQLKHNQMLTHIQYMKHSYLQSQFLHFLSKTAGSQSVSSILSRRQFKYSKKQKKQFNIEQLKKIQQQNKENNNSKKVVKQILKNKKQRLIIFD